MKIANLRIPQKMDRVLITFAMLVIALCLTTGTTALELEALPYPLKGLEPVFSEEALTIHYTKHHKTYADRFAQALEEAKSTSPYLRNIVNLGHTAVLQQLNKFPAALRTRLLNNGGGFVNHAFFWKCMRPYQEKNALTPNSALEKAIIKAFGTFDEFKKRFYEVGLNVFGSGWAWLYADPAIGEGVFIMETANQETPVMTGKVPLLTLDVWEHSYYLNFKNMRATYANDWWHVVNWPYVEEQYDKYLANLKADFPNTAPGTCAAPSASPSGVASSPMIIDNTNRAPAPNAAPGARGLAPPSAEQPRAA